MSLGRSGASRITRFAEAIREARGKLDLLEAEYVVAANAISALHEALEFMRSCELSGETGADHPTVLRALEMARAFAVDANAGQLTPRGQSGMTAEAEL